MYCGFFKVLKSVPCMMTFEKLWISISFDGGLKGLSYEIDFKNVDENWQILALTRAAAGFWIFQKHL